MDLESKAAQRQKEFADLQALVAGMESDGEEDFDPNQKVVIDKEFQMMGQQGDQILKQFGQQPQKPQQQQFQQQQQMGGGGQQFDNEAAQLRQQKMNELQNLIGELSDDDDDTDYKPQKIEMDPEMASIMNQCQQMSSQFGLDNNVNQIPKQQTSVAPPAPKAPPSGNSQIDQDNRFTQISSITSINALLLEKTFYEQNFVNNKSQAYQQQGKTQIGNINQMLLLLSKKIKSGDIGAEKYKETVNKSFKIGQDLFKQAKSENNKAFTSRLGSRCFQMQQEVQGLKKNAEAHFQSVIVKLPVDNSKPANYVYEIDTKSIGTRVQEIGFRNIQYYNLWNYYRLNMADIKAGQINDLKALLGDFKDKMEGLKKSEDVKIGQFLAEKAPEVNENIFYGMPQQTYKAQIKTQVQTMKSYQQLELNFKELIKNKRNSEQQQEICAQNIERYNNEINELEEQLNNQNKVMIPIPLFQQTEEQRNIKVANTAIEKYQIKIAFKRLVNVKADKYQINWSLDINNKIVSEETGWCDKSLVFDYSKSFVTGNRNNPYNNIHKKKISVNLISKGFFSNNSCGNGQLDLGELETNGSYEGLMDINHKGKTYQLEFGVYIREPIASSQFASGKTKTLKIVKRFPAFNPNQGAQEYVQKKLADIKDPDFIPSTKKEEKPKPKPQPEKVQENTMEVEEVKEQEQPTQQIEIKPKQPEQQPAASGLTFPVLEHLETHPDMVLLKNTPATEIPAGIDLELILRPENPNKSQCISYYTMFEKDLGNGILTFSKAGNRKEKRLATSLSEDILRAKMIMEKAVNNGDLDQEDYIEGVQGLMKTDELLIKFYESKNLQQPWAQFVKVRLEVCKKELAGELQ